MDNFCHDGILFFLVFVESSRVFLFEINKLKFGWIIPHCSISAQFKFNGGTNRQKLLKKYKSLILSLFFFPRPNFGEIRMKSNSNIILHDRKSTRLSYNKLEHTHRN